MWVANFRKENIMNNIKTTQQLDTSKEIYTVKEIAEMLRISNRGAYNFVNTTKEFKVLHVGKCIRVGKKSFDEWFRGVTTDL